MLTLDSTFLAGAVPAETLAARRKAAAEVFARFQHEGKAGFLDLFGPAAKRQAEVISQAAVEITANRALHNYVNLGIGGSALGGEAVLRALLHPLQNERTGADGFQRYYYPDNIDPDTNAAVLETLDPRETFVHVASKSGATAETAAQLMIFTAWLEKHLGRETASRHIAVSTDPASGDLRTLAMAQGYRMFEIPSHVGGRFSVLGSLGLLPLALFGRDGFAFLAGAERTASQCFAGAENPALMFASLLHAQHADANRNVLVFMAYADALAATGEWFAQLWAESLGKERRAGSTLLRTVGATDQHSQLQLLAEGPDDKTILFVRVAQFEHAVPIPPAPQTGPSDYLVGHSLAELLAVESLATEKALVDAERPSAALTLARLDEASLGALFCFLELTTVYAGALYGVNPFDQPGVEAGKRLAYGYLGRAGFESEGAALRAFVARARNTVVFK